jgi:hypothetical protein
MSTAPTEKNFKHCVLVNLTIHCWSANKQDPQVAAEVAAAKGVADVKMGRYWKSLLPKCDEVALVQQAISHARQFHYTNTHAYMHDGPRILPVSHYPVYKIAMQQIREEFDLAVSRLVARFDDLKLDAERLMGSLYNELDYPDKNYVQERYSLGTIIMPLPAADALLQLGFDDALASEMKDRLEVEITDRFRKNARSLWQQLSKNIDGLLKTLGDSKKSVLNKSLDVTRRMAQLLPELNVVEDHRLDAVCVRLLEVLDGATHASLAVDLEQRDQVSADLKFLRSTIRTSLAISVKSSEVLVIAPCPKDEVAEMPELLLAA